MNVFRQKAVFFSKWIIAIYPLMIGLQFVHLFINSFRHGVIISVILLIMLFWLIFIKKIKVVKSDVDLIVLFYFIYNVFSILLLLLSKVSISIGIAEFATGLFPVLFYLVGRDNSLREQLFLQYFLKSVFFMIIVGYIFYIFNPEIYFRYMENNSYMFFRSVYMQNPRMVSFIGSSSVGALSTCSFAYFIHQITMKKEKMLKNMCIGLLSLGAAILSLQRVAWLCCILIIISYSMFVSRNKLRTAIIMSIFIILAVIIITNFPNLVQVLEWRINGSENIFSERNGNWLKVFDQNILSLLLGNGLGSSGHRAMEQNKMVIVDGNYFKMIYEIGLIGTGLFIMIIIAGLLNGYKKFRKGYKNMMMYLAFVSVICIHGIGSSVFTFQIVVILFWYSLGRCQAKISGDLLEGIEK